MPIGIISTKKDDEEDDKKVTTPSSGGLIGIIGQSNSSPKRDTASNALVQREDERRSDRLKENLGQLPVGEKPRNIFDRLMVPNIEKKKNKIIKGQERIEKLEDKIENGGRFDDFLFGKNKKGQTMSERMLEKKQAKQEAREDRFSRPRELKATGEVIFRPKTQQEAMADMESSFDSIETELDQQEIFIGNLVGDNGEEAQKEAKDMFKQNFSNTATDIKGIGVALSRIALDPEIRKGFGEDLLIGTATGGADTVRGIGVLLQKAGAYQWGQNLKASASRLDVTAEKLKIKFGQNEEIAIDPDASFSEKIQDPEYLSTMIGQTLPQLVASLVVGGGTKLVTKSKKYATIAGSLVAGTQVAGSSYQQAIDFGASETEAQNVAILTGVGSAWLESIPLGNIFKGSRGAQFKIAWETEVTRRLAIMAQQVGASGTNIIRQGLEEGATESLQEIYTNALAKVMYDPERDVMDGAVESGFFGFLMGLGTGATVETVGLGIQGVSEFNEAYAQMSKAERQGGFLALPNLGGDGSAPEVDVDSDSNIFYHGTNADFDNFDLKKIGSATDDGMWGRGIYFSDKDTAKNYGKNIKKARLSIENPFILNDYSSISELADLLDMSVDALTITDGVVRPILSQSGQFSSKIKSLGYDAIVLKRDGKSTETIVFDTEQINAEYDSDLDPALIEEANKFDNAEDFVSNYGTDASKIDAENFTGGKIKVFHQTNDNFETFDKDQATFFNTKTRTASYGRNTVEAVIDIKKPLNMGTEIWIQTEQPALIEKAKKKGYDAVTFTHYMDNPNAISQVISLKPLENTQTKKQLESIWNTAQDQNSTPIIESELNESQSQDQSQPIQDVATSEDSVYSPDEIASLEQMSAERMQELVESSDGRMLTDAEEAEIDFLSSPETTAQDIGRAYGIPSDMELTSDQVSQAVRMVYEDAGQSDFDSEFSKAEETLSMIMVTLDLAEAGKRFPVGDGTWSGKPSTFPGWLPDRVRNTEMISKLMDFVSNNSTDGTLVSGLSYPKIQNKDGRLFEIVDALYEQLDVELDVDTSIERNRLIDLMGAERKTMVDKARATATSMADLSGLTKAERYDLVKKQYNEIDRRRFEERADARGRKDQKKIENRATKRQVQFEKREAKREVKKAKKEARETTRQKISELRNKFDNKISDLKAKYKQKGKDQKLIKKEITALKKDLVDFIAEKLPKVGRGNKELFSKIKNVETINDFIDARDRVLELAKAFEQKQLQGRIRKELKSTKVKSQSGKPVSKFGDADIQKALNEISANIDGDYIDAREGIEKLIVENSDMITGKETDGFLVSDLSPEVSREIDMLSMVGIKDMDTSQLQNVLANIKSLKEQGKTTQELKAYNRFAQREAWVEKGIEVVTGGESYSKRADPFSDKTPMEKFKAKLTLGISSIVGWSDVLDAISFKDKDSKMDESFLSKFGDMTQEKSNEKAGVERYTDAMQDAGIEIFGVDNVAQLNKKLSEDTARESLGNFVDNNGDGVDLRLSRSEARKRYMEMQDPSLASTFDAMGYTQEMKTAITDFLTVEDMKFAEWQLAFYREYYNTVNDVYRDYYGVDLPFNEFYSPIRRMGFESDEQVTHMLNREGRGKTTATGSMKSRVGSNLPLAEQNDFGIMLQHIVQMEHFKAFAYKIRDMRSLFDDPRFKQAVRATYGSSALTTINGFLDDFTVGGMTQASSVGWIDSWMGSMYTGVLAVKLPITLKQLTSAPAMALNIPTVDWVKNTALFLKNPMKNTKFLIANSPALRTRGSNVVREMVDISKTSEAKNIVAGGDTFADRMAFNIRLGDQGAIVLGGWAVYKYHYDIGIKNGKTESLAQSDAILMFEKAFNKTQQSTDLDLKSQVQRGGTFARMVGAFLSSPNQYLRIEMNVIRNAIAGRASKKQLLKTIFIMHVVLPNLFLLAGNAFKGEFEPEEHLVATVLGPISGFYLVGDMVTSMVRGLVGLKTFDSELPVYRIKDEVLATIRMFTSGNGISDKDVVEVMEQMVDMLEVTPDSRVAGAGALASQAISTVDGFMDVADGSFRQGLGRILGYTRYQVGKTRNKKGSSAGGDLEDFDLDLDFDFDFDLDFDL